MTAIMGPSGAGKTSLLNVLSGYRSRGVKGHLSASGSTFQKLSCYITQEDHLQPLFNVEEVMNLVASLKLPVRTTEEERKRRISEVLTLLALQNTYKVPISMLSGGQRKRLSVAMELINNPRVIFLDEPTSGLDNVSAKQCLELLKTLAHQGHTIVCTIHQPSALLFQLFTHVYVVAAGMCVYQGSTLSLVPFLFSLGIHCPTNYNPADFVIELTDGEKSNISLLSRAIINGLKSWSASGIETIGSDHKATEMAISDVNGKAGDDKRDERFTQDYTPLTQKQAHTASNSTTPWTQFIILLKCMMLQISRNKVTIKLQIFHHIFCGVAVGIMFYKKANDGHEMFNQMKFCVAIVLFATYTWIMAPILLFPNEVKLLKKEHFNQWYCLISYYMALIVSHLPLKVFYTMIFLIPVYLLSGLPLEAGRFSLFSLIIFIVCLIAESFGYAIGSIFNMTQGSVLGPLCIAPTLGLTVYGFDFAPQIPWLLNLIMKTSFMRGGAEALVLVIYGMDRKVMDCDQVYCHYRDPKVILKMLDLQNTSVWMELLILCSLLVIFRTIMYISLSWRLRT